MGVVHGSRVHGRAKITEDLTVYDEVICWRTVFLNA